MLKAQGEKNKMINYDKINRFVVVKIGDVNVHVSFSLSALEKLENDVFKNLITFVDSGDVPTLSQLVKAFKIGAMDANKALTEEKANDLALELMRGEGIPELMRVFYVTLGVSGIMGEAASAQLMENFGVTSRDEKPKNAQTEKPTKAAKKK